MRSLIILRGPRGSGRQKFAQSQGLSPWLIDQGYLEAALCDVVTDPEGGYRQDPYHRNRARSRVLSIISEKMSRGNLIVLLPSDPGVPCARAVASSADRMTAAVIEQARRRRYRTHIVDFTELASTSSTSALRAQSGQPFLSPEEIEQRLRRIRGHIDLPSGDDITWHDAGKLARPLLDLVEPAPIDLSTYRNIVAIGDIHGCLKTFLKLSDDCEIRGDTAYVFLGDYISKGPDSGGVLRTLLDNYMPRDNCFFLTGNHERPLEDWVAGVDPAKKVFTATSLPSLERAGITRQDADAFLERTVDAAWLHWRGRKILATHGGFARPPEALAPLSAEHFQHGTDTALFDVDRAWEENVYAGIIPDNREMIQIHGHRNPMQRPAAAGAGSFNLEDGIDRGGRMRALVLSDEGASYRARTLAVSSLDGTLQESFGTLHGP